MKKTWIEWVSGSVVGQMLNDPLNQLIINRLRPVGQWVTKNARGV